MYEEQDLDLRYTALRESEEETGLDIKKVDINGISKDVIQAATDGDVYMIYSRGSKYYKSLDDTNEVHVSSDTTLQQDFYQMVHKSNVSPS